MYALNLSLDIFRPLLAGNPALGDGGVRAITAAAAGTAVRELELGGCGASPEALAEAGGVLMANRFAHRSLDPASGDMSLAGLGLTDVQTTSLADALAANRSLTALDCRGCAFSAAGVARLAAGVRGGGVLRRLELSVGAAGGPFSVGDAVVLTADYEKHGNAKDGSLKPGDVGTVVKVDTDDLPYLVAYNGKQVSATEGHGAPFSQCGGLIYIMRTNARLRLILLPN